MGELWVRTGFSGGLRVGEVKSYRYRSGRGTRFARTEPDGSL
jgi:hypothetical protein